MELITVFTPTYNRSKTIKKCYESLIEQTSKDFLWQIIDDGSTDNTEELVKEFINENKINIQYIKKENGGKVSAINRSLDETKTELWVCLDSDDYFFPSAIFLIKEKYNEIKDNPKICGLFGLRSNPDGTPMQGLSIPRSIDEIDQMTLRYKYKIPPEYVQIYKTEVISKYRYPLFPNEKYVPLSYMQDQIDQDYKFKIFHEPMMVCEYQNEGITKNQKKLIKNNPKGYTEFKKQQIIFAPNLLFKIKSCITYDTGCILSNEFSKIFKSPSKGLSIICIPLAFVDYLLRYKNVK